MTYDMFSGTLNPTQSFWKKGHKTVVCVCVIVPFLRETKQHVASVYCDCIVMKENMLLMLPWRGQAVMCSLTSQFTVISPSYCDSTASPPTSTAWTSLSQCLDSLPSTTCMTPTHWHSFVCKLLSK